MAREASRFRAPKACEYGNKEKIFSSRGGLTFCVLGNTLHVRDKSEGGQSMPRRSGIRAILLARGNGMLI